MISLNLSKWFCLHLLRSFFKLFETGRFLTVVFKFSGLVKVFPVVLMCRQRLGLAFTVMGIKDPK